MRDKRIMNYRGYVIWKCEYGFSVSLKRDGTDDYFETLEKAMEAIDSKEDH